MDHTPQPIDEYMLAAFLAGTLSQEERQEVLRYLAQNADARELLQMACEALEVAQGAAQPAPPAEASTAEVQARPAADRARAAPHLRLHTHTLGRYLAAAVVVFAIGLSLRLAIGPPRDELRGGPGDDVRLAVEVKKADLEITWTEVPGAYHYEVVIYDPEKVQTVAQYDVKTTHLAPEQISELQTKLVSGRSYMVSVEARNAENRRVQRSESVTFNVDE